MKRQHLLLAIGAVALVMLAVAFAGGLFSSSSKSSGTQMNGSKTAGETAQPAGTKGTQAVEQVQTNPQEYGQNLYRIIMAKYESASLTKQFPFIAEQMQEGYDDDGPVPSNFPAMISVADMAIPSKKLRLVALYQEGAWCAQKYCPFSVYAARPEGWKVVMSDSATANQYLLVDGESVSLILCSQYRKGYTRYRLADGRLERPITVTDGEYFAPAGTFTHDKLAACP